MTEWKKISSSSNTTWDFDTNKTIEGQLLAVKEDVGPNNSKLYSIKTNDGENYDVWGSTALDRDMELVAPGYDVKITYLGYKTNPKTSRKFKNFEVYFRAHEENVTVEVPEISDMPF